MSDNNDQLTETIAELGKRMLRAEIARQNGRKSKGPKTAQGKARSSQNARKHGLTAAKVVLAEHDRTAYEDLRSSYIREFEPETASDFELLDHVVNDAWRLRQLWAIEYGIFSAEQSEVVEWAQDIEEDIADEAVLPSAFRRLGAAGVLRHLDRYEVRLRRLTLRTLEELRRRRRERDRERQGPTGARIKPAA